MNIKFTLSLLLTALTTGSAFGQMSGSYYVPSAASNGFSTVAAAITALNTSGVTANVTINIAGNYVETAPTGGYTLGSATLNASLAANKTLSFVKSSTGANPVLKGYIGTNSANDCIFRIAGADYVTIDSIDLQESTANTTPNTAMEIGYGIFNLNAAVPFDGVNHLTIKNANITLTRSLQTATKAIFSGHTTATGTTTLTITAPTDTHSDNKFYHNNITNSVYGILLSGYSANVALYDQNNDVGGSSAVTGNTFTNMLGDNFTNISVIGGYNQNNVNIANNTIDQMANGGIAVIGGASGIVTTGTNATATVTGNNIKVVENAFNTSFYIDGIYSTSGHLIARKNNITVSEVSGAAVENVGIFYEGGTNLDADSNKIVINQAKAGFTGGIYSSSIGTIKITSDTITLNQTAAQNTARYYAINTVGNATSELIQNNVFLNTNISAGGNGNFSFIYSANGTITKIISGNRTAGTSVHLGSPSNSSTYGIQLADSVGWSVVGSSLNISDNNFSNINADSTGFYGFFNPLYSQFYQSVNIYNNTFSNITTSGSNIYGILYASNRPSNIYGNTISGLTTSGADIFGINNQTGSSTTNNIYRNKLYDFTVSNVYGHIAGISTISSTAANVYNNYIGNFNNTVLVFDYYNPTIKGIFASTEGVNTILNVYYNTVLINSTGNNISAPFCYANNHTASYPNLITLKNNILANTSAGKPSVIFWQGGYNNAGISTASNNNLLYAGSGTDHNIYATYVPTAYDIATLAAYKTMFFPRDSASITGNPPFASTTGSAANFLHFNIGTPTVIESKGQVIPGYTTDFDGETRYGGVGYTGNGTKPDIGADEGNFSVAFPLVTGLTSFTGQQIAEGNKLLWKTAVENKGDLFELERSADGREYQTITTVTARGIASPYSYLDVAPLIGKNYYRLKMSGVTGTYTYSNVVILNQQDRNARISVSPNPATATIRLELPYTGDNTATIRIINMTGSVIKVLQPTAAIMDVDIAYLSAGKYIIEYTDETTNVTTSVVKK